MAAGVGPDTICYLLSVTMILRDRISSDTMSITGNWFHIFTRWRPGGYVCRLVGLQTPKAAQARDVTQVWASSRIIILMMSIILPALCIVALVPAPALHGGIGPALYPSVHSFRVATHPSTHCDRVAAPTSMVATEDELPLPLLSKGYQFCGVSTCIAWTACSWVSMARVPFGVPPPMAPRLHDALCVASALAPLPLIWSYFAALSSASKAGWKRLRSLTYRRLNHALAFATKGALLAVAFAPAATNGIVSYGRGPLFYLLVSAYASAACLCTAVYMRSLKPAGAWTLNPLAVIAPATDGQVSMLCNLLPAPASGSSEHASEHEAGGAPKYAILSIAFGILTCLPLGSFPHATVPSLLGARLARGYAAWTLLAAVACHSLKDAAERGRLSASTYTTLRLGLERFSVWHLVVTALKLLIDSPARYPAALKCPAWTLGSFIAFALVLRPDRAEEAL